MDLGVRVVDVESGTLRDARAIVYTGAPAASTACGWVADVSTVAPNPVLNYVWLEYTTLYRIEIYRDWSLYSTGGATRVRAYEYLYRNPFDATSTFYSVDADASLKDVTIEVGTSYVAAVSNRLRNEDGVASIEGNFLDDRWVLPYNATFICEQEGDDVRPRLRRARLVRLRRQRFRRERPTLALRRRRYLVHARAPIHLG